MGRKSGDFVLTFEEIGLRILLEDFPEQIALALARQWLTRIRATDPPGDEYRVGLRLQSHLRPPRPSTRLPRQIRMRVHTAESTTELRMPGVRTRFSAGQKRAQIEMHPLLGRDPSIVERAVGGALGHALALAGASYLHGAALVAHGLPMLLLGGPGSGKSTVAAAALACGGSVSSDDSLMLYPATAHPLGLRSLRRDLLLRYDSLVVLPTSLRRLLLPVGPASDRRWLLPRSAARHWPTSLEPAVLCILRRDLRLGSFRLERVSQAVGLKGILAANSSPHLLHPAFPSERQRLLALWTRTTSALPTFELRLGPGLLDSPVELLERVVARLRELCSP